MTRPAFSRRTRRPASRDMTTLQSGQREPLFFGEAAPTPFFQPAIQRKCAACEGEEKVQRVPEKKEDEKVQRAADKKEEEQLQRKEAATVSTVPAHAAANYIGSINGKGQPLSAGQQSFYGTRMGADFSQVKIHTGLEAAASAKDINAQAYAYGNHIVFNEGKYQPEASEGKHLLAHELAHVVQQGGAATQLQRQVVPAPPAPAAPAPHFRDCVRSVTGRDDSDAILNAAMNRARDFVNTAIGLLANAPAAGTVYETALATHFGTPLTAAARQRLRAVFQRILGNLIVPNFICNRTACPSGRTQAMWTPDDDLLHICLPFWEQDPTCQAVVIIHEAAHDAGIDLDDPVQPVEVPHSPNRGQPSYPVVGGRRGGRVSRSRRANTPDAYAFFAAQVHNGADTPGDCFN